MFIVSQYREDIVNTDNMLGITVYADGRIYCISPMVEGDSIGVCLLGAYRDKSRAKEVFMDLLNECFPSGKMNFFDTNAFQEILKENKLKMLEGKPLYLVNGPKMDSKMISPYYMPEK